MAQAKKSLAKNENNLEERVAELERLVGVIMTWEIDKHPVTGEQRIKKG